MCGTRLVLPIIEALEAEIGRPVISSNQALLWSALRRAGIPDRLPLGRLSDRQAGGPPETERTSPVT